MAADRAASGAGGRSNGRAAVAKTARAAAGTSAPRTRRVAKAPAVRKAVEVVEPIEQAQLVEQADVVQHAQLVEHAEPATPPHRVTAQPMGPRKRLGIGCGIVVVTFLLVTQLLAIWPAVIAASSTETPRPAAPSTPLLFGLAHMTFDVDVVLILMVLIVGATSALVGVSRRFLHFALRDQLTARDEWSYVLRPFQGAILALVVYFTLRGGFLGQDATSPVNPYGVAAISSLVGLFTRHAVSKLTDVFDTVFGKPREETEPLRVEGYESGATDDDGH